tara:strand:- start:13291 stop:13611 length:321 start_codon:yes stop_codon:yes gene_type:complete
VNKIPTKADLRDELQRQIDQFTCKGGKIEKIDKGVTGRESPHASLKTPLFNEPKITRTPLTDVIAALDARSKSKSALKQKSKPKPKEKIIYDDFGEPLRKVWTNPQ